MPGWSTRLVVSCAAVVALLALGLAPAAADEPVLRIYDIGFLTEPPPDFPGSALGGSAAGDDGGGSEAVAGQALLSVDAIIAAIKTNFFEDSWADKAHHIAAGAGTLVVVNRPEVHDVIARYLGVLRALRARQIQVDATLVEVAPAVLEAMDAAGSGGEAIVLSAAQQGVLNGALARPAEARIVRVARVSAFSGQRVHVRNTRTLTYVKGYSAEVAEDSAVAAPEVAHLDEGCLLDVRPMLEFGEGRVTLHVRFQQQALAEGLPTFDTKIAKMGLLHLPAVEQTAVRTTVTLAPGATALIGLTSTAPLQGERKCLAVLLRPTVLKPIPDPAQPVESSEKRQFAMFDIGFLVRPVEDFPGPGRAVGIGAEEEGGGVGAALMGKETVTEGLVISVEELKALVTQNVAPETWSNQRNRIWTSNAQLLVVQAPEVLKGIREYLAALAQARRRVIAVDVLFLALSGKYGGSGIRGSALDQGAVLGKEAMQALLAEAAKGTDVRVLAQATAAGFSRERVSVYQMKTRNYVKGHDVEIAKGSRIVQPVVGQVTEGLVLDVRPTMMGDGTGILLDLRPGLARLAAEPKAFATGAEAGGLLHLLDCDVLRPVSNLAVHDGEWTVAALAGDAAGETHKAILVRARAEQAK